MTDNTTRDETSGDDPDERPAEDPPPAAPTADKPTPDEAGPGTVPELGGRGGLDPTRYGDWEKNGRCIDF